MRAFLECIPCIIRQSVEVAMMVTDDPALRLRTVQAALKVISTINPEEFTAPEITALVHKELKSILQTKDLYKKSKTLENQQAIELYPLVEQIAKEADDLLEIAVRIAIIGNVIDSGAMLRFDINDVLSKVKTLQFGIFDYSEFKKDVNAKKNILYIGDNAGEIV
ncbi:MAG: ARMT1-like domain-containing protein, partial [Candidatus Margulisiibacteriota bacterium]